uniref:Uncharacterized protein n=1 Tax=Knipowitschia caucasica TaxID=637954 RepID=A0AAV2K753_KNICA
MGIMSSPELKKEHRALLRTSGLSQTGYPSRKRLHFGLSGLTYLSCLCVRARRGLGAEALREVSETDVVTPFFVFLCSSTPAPFAPQWPSDGLQTAGVKVEGWREVRLLCFWVKFFPCERWR